MGRRLIDGHEVGNKGYHPVDSSSANENTLPFCREETSELDAGPFPGSRTHVRNVGGVGWTAAKLMWALNFTPIIV